jgi:heme-degrading monooxygenase HmoA
MFAVIFEVVPKPERRDDYLALGKLLKPELEKIDGFIDNERFTSRRSKGRVLSLSTWRDEKALIRWRTLGVHHATQVAGRERIFADYHLRLGEIIADTGLAQGERLEPQRLDVTEVDAAKVVSVIETQGEVPTLESLAEVLGKEAFTGITDADKRLVLADWRDETAALRWHPPEGVRHRVVRVIRDYGMEDRREAPQYYPPVHTSTTT